MELFSFPMVFLWTLSVDAEFVVHRNVFGATQEVLIQLGVSNDSWLVPIKGPQHPV